MTKEELASQVTYEVARAVNPADPSTYVVVQQPPLSEDAARAQASIYTAKGWPSAIVKVTREMVSQQ